jgi:hypothetical protein
MASLPSNDADHAWLDLVGEVRRAPNGIAALVRIMRYIFATNEPDKPDELVQRLLAAVGEEGKGCTVSY